MSKKKPSMTTPNKNVESKRIFRRFTPGQNWEHVILLISGTVLFLTGLPQKYRTASWSQQILSTPERLETIQQIHHIAAILLILLVIYHLGRAIILMSQRHLSAAIFPTMQDLRDAWQMIKYLLFLSKSKPAFGKYNFEQKFTYWFIFIIVGIMILTGITIWFPELITRFLPGGVIPAAKLAHSTEAIVAAIFIVIWHFYHVHLERLNVSIFTGYLNEEDMKKYHALEYKRLTGEQVDEMDSGGIQ
jgi:formate dehydrogenase gamma subunit